MTLPLAVTMGEPAGIGGEIALKAWLGRGDGVPPFYLIDDPDRLASLARRLGWHVPIRADRRSGEAPAVFDEALPVAPIGRHASAPGRAAPTRPMRRLILGAIETAVARRARRARRGAGDQPDPQGQPLSRRLSPSRPHRVSRRARRDRRSPGDDAGLPGAARRPGHDPSGAAPRRSKACPRPRSSMPAASPTRRCAAISASPLPVLAVAGLNPHAGEAGGLGREEIEIIEPAIAALRARRDRCARPAAGRHAVPCRGAARPTTRRSACITTRR